MHILVTGAAGKLGQDLTHTLNAAGHHVSGLDQAEMDITNFAAVRATVANLKPNAVIHSAAWTDVDGCAREPERAILVNGFGAQHVALAAAEVDAALVYISSNEVFDGELALVPDSDQAQPTYREYDTPRPINAYGYSKWVGEQSVMQANRKAYIVRTAWLFAHGGKNFIHTMLNAAQAGKSLRVVIDEIANPTYSVDLADAVAALIETERYGIYHFVNEGACSRWQFARYALDRTGYADTPIDRITRREWPRPSTPPGNTGLSNLAGRTVGITLRSWQSAIDAFLEREGLFVKDEA